MTDHNDYQESEKTNQTIRSGILYIIRKYKKKFAIKSPLESAPE